MIDFDRICMMFTMQEPFYGILLSSMNRVATERIPTMAISKSGNVFQLNYNPKFLEKFDVNTILELCKHEVLHVAFNHFALWDQEPRTQEEQKFRNISADMEINGYLKRDIMKSEVGGIFASDYGLDNFLGTREYFKIISKANEVQQQQQGQPNSRSCDSGNQDERNGENQSGSLQNTLADTNLDTTSSEHLEQATKALNDWIDKHDQDNAQKILSALDSTPFDDHSEWPTEKADSAEAMQMQQMIDDMLDIAAEECEKNHGEIPGEMKWRIDKIRKKPKPVADWKRYFRRYLGNEFSELIRKSKKRASRRFPDAAGNRHRRKSHILVAIDTSGSVSMPEYREFFGQIKTLSDSATFHVVECDTKIQHEYDFNGHIPDILHGGGGTSFDPPVDLFNKNKRKFDALVYFTDGYSSIPRDTPKETLWVISSGGDKNRKKYRINGASVVFIPEKQK